jgi:large subunit ribosomal protein L30
MAVKSKTQSKSKQDDTAKQLQQLQIVLKRSLIGHPRKHREIVKGLGLRKVNSKVIRKDCPEIRGMINKISYLLEVKELETK